MDEAEEARRAGFLRVRAEELWLADLLRDCVDDCAGDYEGDNINIRL